MTSDEAKKIIVDTVEKVQGCKVIELICNKDLHGVNVGFNGDDIMRMIEELVAENRLVEVEYVLSSMPYRVKSFVLPANTQVKASL